MQVFRPTSFFRLARRAARPSVVLRTLWLAVALLHAWLVVRRWAPITAVTVQDLLISLLCLVGVGYASLKFWRLSTIFDDRPRRALIFCLVLVLGHVVIDAPQSGEESLFSPAQHGLMAAVLPVMGLSLLTLALVGTGRRRRAPRLRTRGPRTFRGCWFDCLIRLFPDFSPSLYRRPPPTCA